MSSLSILQRVEADERDLTYCGVVQFCQKDIHEILQRSDGKTEETVSATHIPPEKEERMGKKHHAQNEQFTSLLEEIKNLYGVVKNLVSGRITKG